MKHPLRYLGLLLLVFALGCDQIIELDLPEQVPVLVVNSLFTPDSTWAVSVTKSQSIQVNDPPTTVTNAVVLIMENGAVIDSLVLSPQAVYVSPTGGKPVAGHVYTVKASAPGYADAIGTDLAPIPVVPYGFIWRDSVVSDEYGQWRGEFSINIDDPAGTKNFYQLSIYRVDSFLDPLDTIISIYQLYPTVQDPVMTFSYFTGAVLFDDETFDGTRRKLSVQLSSQDYDGAFLFFGLSTMSEATYRYKKTYTSYMEVGFNPFAEPVRVYSNMTPGMGVFAGSSTVFDLVP